MPLYLEDIDNDAWNKLEAGAAAADSGFHFITLGSIDEQGHPQARTLVLRRVDRMKCVLEFHTDVRSPKWLALSAHPKVTALGYCNETRIQLRLCGTVELHAQGSECAELAWEQLSDNTRKTYAGPAPGSDVVINNYHGCNTDGSGKVNFGVIVLHINLLDWSLLARDNNQRALLHYSAAGKLKNCKWVNP